MTHSRTLKIILGCMTLFGCDSQGHKITGNVEAVLANEALSPKYGVARIYSTSHGDQYDVRIGTEPFDCDSTIRSDGCGEGQDGTYVFLRLDPSAISPMQAEFVKNMNNGCSWGNNTISLSALTVEEVPSNPAVLKVVVEGSGTSSSQSGDLTTSVSGNFEVYKCP